MKHVIFLGSTDKSHFMMYVCKLLRCAGKKVLLNDATFSQSAKYYLGSFEQGLTEFEGFDVVIHDKAFAELQSGSNLNEYDFVITNTDQKHHMTWNQWSKAHKRYIVTSYERSSLLRDVELLAVMNESANQESSPAVDTERIILSAVECGIDDAYLNHLYDGLHITMPSSSTEIAMDEMDYIINIENQYNNQLMLKRLSRDYKSALKHTCQQILDCDRKQMKVIWKTALRRG
ncbi:hypothetical protein [Longirhabdus pacifica]|uniref:hypothetical protein n=1 Tax=Longirhabdus pacifica TaxID=2305227 RepID=UPI00100932E2|nr:hypothetical protein [Longirhabdus pacifica]